MIKRLSIRTPGQGLRLVTAEIEAIVREAGLHAGLCTIMVQHTSASLTIQENADPSARRDLERWLALTATTLGIPVTEGRLALGTWQGIYLWEHRRHGRVRNLVVHVTS
jgi:thiamine phosphate synthase YjbQ (UPF0047 family)